MRSLLSLALALPVALAAAACTPADVDGETNDGYEFDRVKTGYWYTDGAVGFVVVSDYDVACEDYATGIYGFEDGDEFGIIYFLTNAIEIGEYAVVPDDVFVETADPSVFVQMQFWSVADDGTGNVVANVDKLEDGVSGSLIYDAADLDGAAGDFLFTLPDGSEIDGDFDVEYCASLAKPVAKLLNR